jgi:hypothetical protein
MNETPDVTPRTTSPAAPAAAAHVIDTVRAEGAAGAAGPKVAISHDAAPSPAAAPRPIGRNASTDAFAANRGRGHHSGRHAEARDQEEPERPFDGGRPSIDLMEHQRHRRAELRVPSAEEEGPERPPATPEETTQPCLPVRDVIEHLSCVGTDIARLVHVQRQVFDRGDPPVVDVVLFRVVELTRESNRFLAADQEELRRGGAIRALSVDLFAPWGPIANLRLREQRPIDPAHPEHRPPVELDVVTGLHADCIRDRVRHQGPVRPVAVDHLDVSFRVRAREDPTSDGSGSRIPFSWERDERLGAEDESDRGRQIRSPLGDPAELLVQSVGQELLASPGLLTEPDVRDAVEDPGAVPTDRGIRDPRVQELTLRPREEQGERGGDEREQERAHHDRGEQARIPDERQRGLRPQRAASRSASLVPLPRQ